MVVFSRMGWIVPALWLGSIAVASQVPAATVADHGLGLSRVAFVFIAAAAISTPLLFLAGAVLNRHKVTHTVRRFGKDRELSYGPHTFNMAPIGFYVVAVPVFTIAFYVIFRLM